MVKFIIILTFLLLFSTHSLSFSPENPSNRQILVLVDNFAIKSSHSIFFNSLTSRGYQLELKLTDDPKIALQRYGQFLYDGLIIFAPFIEIPTDVIFEVREATFSLHKFMLVSKSNYIRRLILEYKESDLGKIYLSDIPGGAEAFEKAAKFCYGVNFEITVHNVAALHCAAEFLQMTNKHYS